MDTDEGDQLELGLGLSLGMNKEITNVPLRRRIFTATDLQPTGVAAAGNVIGTNNSSQVVGWPPVAAYRMNNLVTSQTKNAEEDKTKVEELSKKVNNNGNYKTETANSGKELARIGFVKVNMDGMPIGRKVDLNAHLRYETLAQAIENMFFKSATSSSGGKKDQATKISKLLDGSSEFVLTYEDKEGDWMLVGDVPWGMFLSTVKRLRIMRTSDANGIASGFQEKNSRQGIKPN